MIIYLDNCCLNRPFDDQSQLRIMLESEAKLKIQDEIRLGRLLLAWSYILDYENDKNPYKERKYRIEIWRKYAEIDVKESMELLKLAESFSQEGFKKMDSLHIACAVLAKCDYFLTTDDNILKISKRIEIININDPIGFIKEVLS